MSEKNAKEKRKVENTPVCQMVVNCFKNGDVIVQGVPQNYGLAMTFALNAVKAIASMFVQAAVDGKVTKERPSIIKAQTRIIH